MNFIGELKGIIDDPKFGYDEEQFMIKTGFTVLDYLNGNIAVKDDGTKKYNLGVDAGKIITIIGKTGAGKSTLGIQIGTSIIRKYDQGSMFILDFEQSNGRDRVRSITGMSEEEFDRRVAIKKIGISTETVLQIVSQIKQLKLKHKKELLTDNSEGVIDLKTGKLQKILPPTVVLVDSVAMMMPLELVEGEEMKGNMSATSMARANTQLFKKLVQPCMEANIIMIFINHITAKVEIGATPTQASINYLKQNESLPGGLAPQYLTNTLIKITTSSKLDEEKTYKIKGFEAKIELIKSRTAPAGRVVNMIFNQAEGFDEELSLLDYIKANGGLKGGGRSYYLEGMDDVKFSLGDFKQKVSETPELKTHLQALGEAYLAASLKESSKAYSPLIPEIDEDIEVEGIEE